MEKTEFERKIREIKGKGGAMGMTTVVMVFTDRERHVTQAWTIRTGTKTVNYQDVHCTPNSAPIRVSYDAIADVENYH